MGRCGVAGKRVKVEPQFPDIMYVSAHDVFDEDEGPFVCCTPEKDAMVESCEDQERVAVYKLVKVMNAVKSFDLK